MIRARIVALWMDLRDRGLILLLVSASILVLYLRTLAPSVLPGDAGEFQFAAWGWTLAHPTGYPLYLILGGLWQHLLPFGNPAWRLNLFSAVIAAVTIGLTYRVLFRVTPSRGAATVGALALGVSPTFWSQATESEVYALNTLFVVLLTWLGLRFCERHERRYSVAWALVLGLSFAHHRTTILLLPAFAALFTPAILARVGKVRGAIGRDPAAQKVKRLGLEWNWLFRDAVFPVLVALPLLLYAYIPLRGPATPYAQLTLAPGRTIIAFENTPQGWLAQIAGSQFQSELQVDATTLRRLEQLPAGLIQQFNPLGFALGLIGLGVLLFRRRYTMAAFTLFGFLAFALFDAAYHIGDIRDFYTPAYFFFVIWIVAGLGLIFERIGDWRAERASLVPLILLLSLFCLIPLQNLFVNFVEQDRTLSVQWETRWREILGPDLPEGAILVSNDRDEMTPMWYYQIVEGLRPDALGLFPLISADPAFSNIGRLVDVAYKTGRPVIAIKPMADLGLRYQIDPIGRNLYLVSSAASTTPQQTSHAVVGGRLKVVGYSIDGSELRRGGYNDLLVYWRPLAPLTSNYTTSLQIQDANGNKVAQGKDHLPGGDTYPSSLWQVGETLQDRFTFELPSGLERGVYHLYVRVYVTGSEETLGDLTEIGTIEVK